MKIFGKEDKPEENGTDETAQVNSASSNETANSNTTTPAENGNKDLKPEDKGKEDLTEHVFIAEVQILRVNENESKQVKKTVATNVKNAIENIIDGYKKSFECTNKRAEILTIKKVEGK